MLKKYQIKNLNFVKNKYSCGHETFYCCINNCFDNNITCSQMFFASNPNCFEFLINEVKLGYNSLKDTIESINKNISKKIYWIAVDNKEKAKIDIIGSIQKDNLVVLYLRGKSLTYHNYKESRYPYHVVVADGFDLNNNTIHIVDTYVIDDYGSSMTDAEMNFDFIINDLVEYIIFTKDKNEHITFNNDNVILESLHKIIDESENGSLSKIRKYFCLLENVADVQKKINSIASFKWIIIYPLLMQVKDYSESKVCEEKIFSLKEIVNKWNIMHLKYLKYCYMSSNKNYFLELKIDELILQTKETIESIINELENKSCLYSVDNKRNQ